MLIAVWGHLSRVSERNLPIYMIAAAPIVALPVVEWLRALSQAPVARWLRSTFSTFAEIGEELIPYERLWRAAPASACGDRRSCGGPGAGPGAHDDEQAK